MGVDAMSDSLGDSFMASRGGKDCVLVRPRHILYLSTVMSHGGDATRTNEGGIWG